MYECRGEADPEESGLYSVGETSEGGEGWQRRLGRLWSEGRSR